LLLSLALPAAAQFEGRIVSSDRALEGVVVSARKTGSPVTVSVVSNAEGRFSFPAARLEPGSYALRIRATGYELEAPRSIELGDGGRTEVDLKLRKAADLAAQLTNAEWLASFPGSADQKKFLYSCVGCHTLERIAKSSHDAAGFVQVMKVSSVDRVKAKELDGGFEKFKHLRPDLLGTLRVWTGPDSFVEANYFESEAAARAGEKADMPPEVDALMAEFGDAMANTEFLDLTVMQVR
jgi:hypothetical protein